MEAMSIILLLSFFLGQSLENSEVFNTRLVSEMSYDNRNQRHHKIANRLPQEAYVGVFGKEREYPLYDTEIHGIQKSEKEIKYTENGISSLGAARKMYTHHNNREERKSEIRNHQTG